MKLDRKFLESINYWSIKKYTKNGTVMDSVVLNLGNDRIEVFFDFPCFKSLIYNENMKDYVYSFASDFEFITFWDQLRLELPYLEFIYNGIESMVSYNGEKQL